MTKIYLGILSRNMGVWAMFESVLKNFAVLKKNGIEVQMESRVGDSLLCRGRQELTARFLETDCDYFMQMDDDIELPPDGMLKLVQANKPIVGGVYRLKNNSGKAALKTLKAFKLEEHPDELIKIKYLSTGCFMQKREVVEKMAESYPELEYRAIERKDMPKRWALYKPMIYKEEYLSEDWAYCQRAEDIGYDIWLHTGVKCNHWGLYNYNL